MAPHCFSIRSHNCNQLEGTGGSVVVRAAGLLERWNFKLELEKQSIYHATKCRKKIWKANFGVCTKLELEIPSQKKLFLFLEHPVFP